MLNTNCFTLHLIVIVNSLLFSSFYFFAVCCEKLLVNYKENLTDAFQHKPIIFNIYEIENYTINEKAHYITEDSGRGIWFGECGLWIIGGPNDRYFELVKNISFVLLPDVSFFTQRFM